MTFDDCAKHLAIGLIRTYEYTIRPVLGPSCRFLPSCSEYAKQALQIHGTMMGSYLSFKRLCRCHPFHAGGIDEVPVQRPSGASSRGTTTVDASQQGKDL